MFLAYQDLVLKVSRSHETPQYTWENQDNYIPEKFRGFFKSVLERGSSVLPCCTRDHGTKFFIKIFSTVRPFQTFSIPSLTPKFSEPSTPFDLSPPIYQKVTRVIRRMKSSGSPSPLE